jgi:polyisoprenyl-phosphate glycosyltransferase
MISLVIPVYRNSANIAPLLAALTELRRKLSVELEVDFVVDGSPDDSFLQLQRALPTAGFRSKLLLLSRNFGSFPAIRAGLEVGEGEYFAVMAADLQEPPELVIEFFERMAEGGAEVVIGKREGRCDPFFSRALSATFWWLYRRMIQPQIPKGGVDVFGCRRNVRDCILRLGEQNSSLVGLLFWVGFRRQEVSYKRRSRTLGKSAWTIKKKLRYLSDSVFNFTDLPIRALTMTGFFGLLITLAFGLAVVAARVAGAIDVPGYAATVLLVMFFGTLNCFGLGVVGGYVWRTFENSKARPNYIISSHQAYAGAADSDQPNHDATRLPSD